MAGGAARSATGRTRRARRCWSSVTATSWPSPSTGPTVRNALDSAMRDGLVEALTVAARDPSVTAVHLRGAGDSFCSGGDLDEFGSRSDPPSPT